jgi:hypothetical protein
MNISQVIKHIGYNTDPHLLTDFCVANIAWEYITMLLLWLKRYKILWQIDAAMQQPDTETNAFLRNGFLSNTRDTENKSTLRNIQAEEIFPL